MTLNSWLNRMPAKSSLEPSATSPIDGGRMVPRRKPHEAKNVLKVRLLLGAEYSNHPATARRLPAPRFPSPSPELAKDAASSNAIAQEHPHTLLDGDADRSHWRRVIHMWTGLWQRFGCEVGVCRRVRVG
jgi:hypothetical protein